MLHNARRNDLSFIFFFFCLIFLFSSFIYFFSFLYIICCCCCCGCFWFVRDAKTYYVLLFCSYEKIGWRVTVWRQNTDEKCSDSERIRMMGSMRTIHRRPCRYHRHQFIRWRDESWTMACVSVFLCDSLICRKSHAFHIWCSFLFSYLFAGNFACNGMWEWRTNENGNNNMVSILDAAHIFKTNFALFSVIFFRKFQ